MTATTTARRAASGSAPTSGRLSIDVNMRSLASRGAEGYSSEHSRKIPPDWQVEGPPMKWNINWGSVIATIAIMLTIAGSTAGATRVISSEIAEIKTGQVRLEERLSSQIAELKTGQARLEERLSSQIAELKTGQEDAAAGQ